MAPKRERDAAAAAGGGETKRRRSGKAVEAPAVAAAAVPATVDVWSLRSALSMAVQYPGPALVRVRAVEVRHATALHVLLHRQKASKGWKLRKADSGRLDALVHFDALLSVGIHAHIPIVRDHLYTHRFLNALRDWTWEILTAARDVTPEVFNLVNKAGNKARKLVARALQNADRANLAVKMRRFAELLTALKSTTVVFPAPAAAAAPAAVPAAAAAPAAAPAAADAPAAVDVWSLRSAQSMTVRSPGPAQVRVRAVEIWEATGVVVLLHRQQTSRGWNLLESDSLCLDTLVLLDALLTIGIEAHVPLIRDHIYDNGYLTALMDWTWQVEEAAGGVTPAVFARVTTACDKVRKFVGRALKRGEEASLTAKISKFAGMLTALKIMTVIPPPPPNLA